MAADDRFASLGDALVRSYCQP